MSLTSAFNKHFEEFINHILDVFPNNVDLLTAKNALNVIKRANPKMLVNIWIAYLVIPYKEEIDNGNINFFIIKDYSKEISNMYNSDKIMDSIDRLRKPIQEMTLENQQISMKYIQNLSKLSLMCQSK